MSSTVATPLMMALRIAAIPLTMAISTLPTARKMEVMQDATAPMLSWFSGVVLCCVCVVSRWLELCIVLCWLELCIILRERESRGIF